MGGGVQVRDGPVRSLGRCACALCWPGAYLLPAPVPTPCPPFACHDIDIVLSAIAATTIPDLSYCRAHLCYTQTPSFPPCPKIESLRDQRTDEKFMEHKKVLVNKVSPGTSCSREERCGHRGRTYTYRERQDDVIGANGVS